RVLGLGGNTIASRYPNTNHLKPSGTLLGTAELATMVQQLQQRRAMYMSNRAEPAVPVSGLTPTPSKGVGLSPRQGHLLRLEEQQQAAGHRMEPLDPSRTFGMPWQYNDSPMSVLTDGQQLQSSGGAAPDIAAVEDWVADPYGLSSQHRAPAVNTGSIPTQRSSQKRSPWQLDANDGMPWRSGAPGRLEGLFNAQQVNLAHLVESPSSLMGLPSARRTGPQLEVDDGSVPDQQMYSPPSKLSSVGLLLALDRGPGGETHRSHHGGWNMPSCSTREGEAVTQHQQNSARTLICPPSSCEKTTNSSSSGGGSPMSGVSSVGRLLSYDAQRSSHARSTAEEPASMSQVSMNNMGLPQHIVAAAAPTNSAASFGNMAMASPAQSISKTSPTAGLGSPALDIDFAANVPPMLAGELLSSPSSSLTTPKGFGMQGWGRRLDVLIAPPLSQRPCSSTHLHPTPRSVAGAVGGLDANNDEILLELEIAQEAAELEPLRHDDGNLRLTSIASLHTQQLSLQQPLLPLPWSSPRVPQLDAMEDRGQPGHVAPLHRELIQADSLDKPIDGPASPASSCGSARTPMALANGLGVLPSSHAVRPVVSPSIPRSCCSVTGNSAAFRTAENQLEQQTQPSSPLAGQQDATLSTGLEDTGSASSSDSRELLDNLLRHVGAETGSALPSSAGKTSPPHQDYPRDSLELRNDVFRQVETSSGTVAVEIEVRNGNVNETVSPLLEQECAPAANPVANHPNLYRTSPSQSHASAATSSDKSDKVGLAWLESQLP
ncbi:hypothetical protein Vretifemale_18705, partial [Volvox reticuliferus]